MQQKKVRLKTSYNVRYFALRGLFYIYIKVYASSGSVFVYMPLKVSLAHGHAHL